MKIRDTHSQNFHLAQVEFFDRGAHVRRGLRNERMRIDMSEVQFEDCASYVER
jgi:hypothetical protein